MVRGFPSLWLTTAGGNLGDGLVVTVFPLLATQLTDDPRLIAGAAFAHTLPYTICPLLAGVAVDRTDRRWLIFFANLVRAAAALVLAAALVWGLGALPLLYAAAFLIGVGENFADIGANAMVPSVAGDVRLDRANSWLHGTELTLNQFVGPPLGGVLVLAGAGVAAGGIAGAFIIAAAGMLLLRGRHRPIRTERTTIRADLAEGLRFQWRHRVLRTIVLMVTVMAAAWSAWTAVLVIHVVRPGPVGLNAVGFGVLLSMLAVGGVAGSLLAPWAHARLGTRTVMAIGVIGAAVMLGTTALSTNAWVIGAATVVGGLGSGGWNVVVRTLRQRITPDEMLGRAAGAGRLLGWGAVPLGAGLAGLIAHAVGPRAVFGLAATVTALMIVPVLRVITEERLRAVTIEGARSS